MGEIINYYTDGAATMKQVNGIYERGAGGSAIAIANGEKIIFAMSQGFDQATNNYCELYAIKMALEHFSNHYNTEEDIANIYSDSAYCINMLKEGGWIYSWERNGWTRGKKHEKIENLELIQEIYSYLKKFNITFCKVKGHSNNVVNDYVDKLAVEAKIEHLKK